MERHGDSHERVQNPLSDSGVRHTVLYEIILDIHKDYEVLDWGEAPWKSWRGMVLALKYANY